MLFARNIALRICRVFLGSFIARTRYVALSSIITLAGVFLITFASLPGHGLPHYSERLGWLLYLVLTSMPWYHYSRIYISVAVRVAFSLALHLLLFSPACTRVAGSI